MVVETSNFFRVLLAQKAKLIETRPQENGRIFFRNPRNKLTQFSCIASLAWFKIPMRFFNVSATAKLISGKKLLCQILKQMQHKKGLAYFPTILINFNEFSSPLTPSTFLNGPSPASLSYIYGLFQQTLQFFQ